MAHPKPTIDINAFDALPDDLVITEADVALLFGQPLITRRRHRRAGIGPVHIMLGQDTRPRYRVGAVRSYLAQLEQDAIRRRQSRSELMQG